MKNNAKNHYPKEIDWPEFGIAVRPARQPAVEFEKKIAVLHSWKEARTLTHTAVYENRSNICEWCQMQRTFMTQVPGIELPDEVLPLSKMAGMIPPFRLWPNTII